MSRIGQWRCTRVLGQGAFGVVYEAQDERNRSVAIKVADGPHQQTRERFLREVSVMQALPRNRHLVGYIDSGWTDDAPYLVMEYVEGVTLKDIVDEAPLPEDVVLSLMLQLCEALGELHQMGLSHGDIKPDNVMMTRGERPHVKLLDFGLVRDSAGLLRRMEERRRLPTEAFQQELDAGVLMGTPQYLAPESISDAWATHARRQPASDVFALGVILAELLTGKAPWPFRPQGTSRRAWIREMGEYLDRRLNADGMQLARPHNVRRELWQIVRTCLLFDPERRFAHALHIRDALLRYDRRGALIKSRGFRGRARVNADRVAAEIRDRQRRIERGEQRYEGALTGFLIALLGFGSLVGMVALLV